MPTLAQEVLSLVAASPGLTDRELTDRLKGPHQAHQHINSVCRKLAKRGLLHRDQRADGLIGNYPHSADQHLSNASTATPTSQPNKQPTTNNLNGGFKGTTQISVHIQWRIAGEVDWDEAGKPIFPSLHATPGLYRLRFSTTREVYIGESDNLRRRGNNYRSPGSTQQTSTWVNERLKLARENHEMVFVETCEHARVEVRGAAVEADLKAKPVRLLLENAALLDESQSGWRILNRQA